MMMCDAARERELQTLGIQACVKTDGRRVQLTFGHATFLWMMQRGNLSGRTPHNTPPIDSEVMNLHD